MTKNDTDSCHNCPKLHKKSTFSTIIMSLLSSVLLIQVSGLLLNQAEAASLTQQLLESPQLDLGLQKDFFKNYSQALNLSLLFYEAQRSGKLPEDTRIPWRGDSALDDKGNDGEDLTGGYYDAGDYVKFVWTQAAAMTLLAWGMLQGQGGYQDAGLRSRGLQQLKWGTDFLVKCHIKPNQLYAQVGDFETDHKFWGRPEEINFTRPAYKIDEQNPGSDLAGEVSAALSATSLVFCQQGDSAYAATLLHHAEELYHFANSSRGLYKMAMKNATYTYFKSKSDSYGDEMAWAAAWLHRATNNITYLKEAERHYKDYQLYKPQPGLWVGFRGAGVQVLLAQITGEELYRSAAGEYCARHAVAVPAAAAAASGACRGAGGLLCSVEGERLPRAANVAFLCLQVAAMGMSPRDNLLLATEQLDYILGTPHNTTGMSYMVGYGDKAQPQYPNHKASACPPLPEICSFSSFSSPLPNPHILLGALVSGPNPADHFRDQRGDSTEVTTDFNAGLQSALAIMVELLKDPGALPDRIQRKRDFKMCK